jgi:hypothetical protein
MSFALKRALNRPSHPAAAGGKLFLLRRQDARASVAGQANGLRSANAFTYSSRRFFIGAETVTDIKSSAPY